MSKEKKRLFSQGELFKILLWSWPFNVTFNYQRGHALGYLVSMLPALKKLHPTKKELIPWLKMNMDFYLTNPVWNRITMGLDMAMQEEGADIETVRSVKSGIFGPLAGLGDTIHYGLLRSLINPVAAQLAIGGSILGPIVFLVGWFIAMWGQAWLFLTQAYKQGSALVSTFTSETMSDFRTIMEYVGVFMTGAISCYFVWVKAIYKIPDIGFDLQAILDGFMPGVLPLTFVLLAFSMYRKGWPTTRIILVMFVIGFILGGLGLIGATW